MSNPPGSGPGSLIRIIEIDGNVVEMVATTPAGEIHVITEMAMDGQDLILSGLHVDGPGSGSLGLLVLRFLARDLGLQHGANRVIIQGAPRTTGANPGHLPRPIILSIEEPR